MLYSEVKELSDLISKELRSFMENLVWLRRQQGFSKVRMAKLLGIGTKTINRIESGEFPSGLSVKVILRASRVFHIAAKDLFDPNLPSIYHDLEK